MFLKLLSLLDADRLNTLGIPDWIEWHVVPDVE